MQPLTSEVLSRFHRTLVEEIQRTRPEYLTGAFTVAEIYQNLVPYRSHRDRIGVEMNGDYEDALLRLLAGEGDYLVLESEHARRELREELESSNPNTGLFREYAAADVRLNQARIPASVSWEPEDASLDDEPRFELPVEEEEAAPGGEAGSPDHLFGDSVTFDMSEEHPVPVEDLAPTPAEASTRSAEPAASPSTPTDCRWCREPLPRRDTLNYCPFCGANVHLVPCPNCGEELEPTWRFCVACGTEAAAEG